MGPKRKQNKSRRAAQSAPGQITPAFHGAIYTVRMPRGIQSFLPRRFITTIKSVMQGYYLAPSAQPNGVFNVQASAAWEPWNNVGIPISSTGANKSNVSLSTSYSATDSGIGYQELQSLYTYYKVRWAKMTARGNPTNGSDQFVLSLYPSQAAASTASIKPTNSQPYSKETLCVGGARPVTLSVGIDSATILGYTPSQFEGISPTLVGSSPGSTLQWFFNVMWQNTAPGNPVSSFAFLFELWQEVEFTELTAFST